MEPWDPELTKVKVARLKELRAKDVRTPDEDTEVWQIRNYLRQRMVEY
jgi:hypothetical protein